MQGCFFWLCLQKGWILVQLYWLNFHFYVIYPLNITPQISFKANIQFFLCCKRFKLADHSAMITEFTKCLDGALTYSNSWRSMNCIFVLQCIEISASNHWMRDLYYTSSSCKQWMFDPEASDVTAAISNLTVDTGMCDVLSPLLGGPHSFTSDTAAKTYSSSSMHVWPPPPPVITRHLLKSATPSDFDRDEATGRGN